MIVVEMIDVRLMFLNLVRIILTFETGLEYKKNCYRHGEERSVSNTMPYYTEYEGIDAISQRRLVELPSGVFSKFGA